MKKILILSANPKNTDKLRLDEEVREIQAALKRAKSREQFAIVTEWAVRVKDLQGVLLDNEPQIVHFSGHGAGSQGLVLEDNSGNMQFVSTEVLATLFELFKNTTECVLLNACYSEAQAEAIHQHIDHVIGMTQLIGDQAAITFAVGFYDALGAGRSYNDAYRFGCSAIAIQGIPESSTPIIKSRQNPASPACELSSESKSESKDSSSQQKFQEPQAATAPIINQQAGENSKQIGWIGNAGNITF